MLIIYDFGMNFEMYVFISFAYANATNSFYNTLFFFLFFFMHRVQDVINKC